MTTADLVLEGGGAKLPVLVGAVRRPTLGVKLWARSTTRGEWRLRFGTS